MTKTLDTTNTTASDRAASGTRGVSRKLLTRKAAALSLVPAGDALEDSFPAAGDGARADQPVGDSGAPALQASDDAARADADTAEPTADAAASEPTSAVTEPVVADDPAENAAPTDPALPALAESEASRTENEPVAPGAPDAVPGLAAAPAPAPAPAAVWTNEDERVYRDMTARRKAAGFQTRGRDVSAQLLRVGDLKPNAGTVVAVVVGLVAERGAVARSALLDLIAEATFSQAKAKPRDRDWAQGYVAGAVRGGFLALAEDDAQPAASVQAA
jgi:hypothetical protein